MALLVVIFFFYLQIIIAPFRSSELNRLEGAGLVVCGVSIYMGYFTYFGESEVIVSMVIIAVNAMWALYLMTIVLANNAVVKRMWRCLASCGLCHRIRSGNITREVEIE